MRKDITGRRFGRLIAIEATDKRSISQSIIWKCKCDCGKYAYVPVNSLTTGNTKSCGCFAAERPNVDAVTKHGDSKDKSEYFGLYRAWVHMKGRCNNPNDAKYHDYGERGIRVCDDWYDYETFKKWAIDNGYDSNLSIDRINNDGDYKPDNCRWADRTTQMNNRRTCHYLDYNGERHTLQEWSNITGLKYTTICHRLQLGWSVEEALSSPPSAIKRRKRLEHD